MAVKVVLFTQFAADPGSILGRVGVLFSLARDIYSPKVLVIPRKRLLRLNMTEKLFTGTVNKNQNKKQNKNICRQNYLVHIFFWTDMFALPDFRAGAMENWGLIVYRETAMLVEDSVSSETNLQRVAEVIAHELAHMVLLSILINK